ncbi:hypothetical protein [Alicyclobacillus sp. SP_1]|uniref:hypothetical protein n=1 Tax=Alicyclobacillus sp. SP_1 TaxID=2942475 RepID=UPI0021585309|nr:hypothetical protein [Alicyclobacillus sp. SP_1]
MGGGTTHQSAVEQTAVGAFTAPPPKKSLKWKSVFTLFFLIGGAVEIGAAQPADGIPTMVIGVVVGYFVYRAWKYNRTTWLTRYKEWSQKWMCNQCGAVFSPQSGAHVSEVLVDSPTSVEGESLPQ